MTDLILAVAHHALVFGLVAMMVAERTLVSASPVDVRRLAGLDAGVGATSALVLGVGIARVVWGGKGWLFYQDNPFFWAKLATFALIGALSLIPTLAFLRWTRARKADAAFQPPEAERRRVHNALGIMILLIVPLVGFAAAMARWPF
ncbi:DUF2214 family protein [Brevundimonas sp.]|uniref:DUF2214 family protein n=1 Tax=Brevundimonas sp. TaxID=1871086 RepID=UPI0035B11A38